MSGRAPVETGMQEGGKIRRLSLRAITRIGSHPDDSDELRLHKAIGVGAIVFGGFPTWITWTALFFLYGEKDVGWIGVGWVAIVVACLITFAFLRRGFAFFRFVTLLTFLIASLLPGDLASTMLGDQATPEKVAALRAQMGLDRPIWERYGTRAS